MVIDATCRICKRIPRYAPHRKRMYDVDHKRPPSSAGSPGSPAYLALFWDEHNWQLTCPNCNASKKNKRAKQ